MFGRSLLLAFLVSFVLLGCAPSRPLMLEPLASREVKTPMLLIPGFSGTRLNDPSGDPIWGRTRRFFVPRDRGYSLALPIDAEARENQGYTTDGVIRRLSLGPIKLDIYGELLDTLEANGYRFGDLDDPQPGDNLFVFAYDWRADNVGAARALAGKLERLREARGESTLRLHVLCHSNASRIARYAMKYGAASLEDAEAGRAGPPAGLHVEKLMLVGTANGGATAGFRALQVTRSYVPWIGRKFHREVNFTFDAAFETLPAYRDDLFFDESGEPLDVDVFDADSWERYGWSIYHPKTAKRLERRADDGLFGTAEQRRAHLERNLDRARRLHAVLLRDVAGWPEARYYLIQNDRKMTPDRMLLARDGRGSWRTYIYPHKRLRKNALLAPLSATPGDGHASVRSQQSLSPQERDAIVHEPLYVDAYHRTVVSHPTSLRAILEYLLE